MTIEEWLADASDKFKEAGAGTARLDAEVLLADALGKDRSWLHAHGEHELQHEKAEALEGLVARRVAHEPLAYIRGRQEFYGRDFYVSPDTLTPRPETETMIELLLDHMNDERRTANDEKLQVGQIERSGERGAESGGEGAAKVSSEQGAVSSERLQILDVGTGSGCIMITAALELSPILNPLSSIRYTGLDISKPALKIAKKNAKKLLKNYKIVNNSNDRQTYSRFESDDERGGFLDFKEFDLLKNDLSSFVVHRSSFILANLPYVPTNFKINLAASHEPAFAIYGGEDGLDYYRKLFEQLSVERRAKSEERGGAAVAQNSELRTMNSLVFTESLPPQHKELANIAQKAGYTLIKTQDFIQVFSKI